MFRKHQATSAEPEGFVERLARSLGAEANATHIFAPPIERDSVTVIPVAKAVYGFGGGGGKQLSVHFFKHLFGQRYYSSFFSVWRGIPLKTRKKEESRMKNVRRSEMHAVQARGETRFFQIENCWRARLWRNSFASL